jgi:hypothetical protein
LNIIFPTTLGREAEDVFVKYLCNRFRNPDFLRLYSIFGKEFFLFISLFEGKEIKVPDADDIRRIKLCSEIYVHVKKGDMADEAFQKASDKYKISVAEVRKIVEGVGNSLKKRNYWKDFHGKSAHPN